MHKTVLLNEAIDNLNVKEDGIYVDAELGVTQDYDDSVTEG